MLREQTACEAPDAVATSGLVAYVGAEPAGWVAVEPRLAYPKLRTSRVPPSGRATGERPHLSARPGRDRLRP